ncbi:hypothetical protein GQ457_11G006170 [Hibiscus cannabinus]
MISHTFDFLLKPIFLHGFSASVHIVLLLFSLISWLVIRDEEAGGEGSKDRFRQRKVSWYKQTLACCFVVSAFNIVWGLLSYFYWYTNEWSDDKLVTLSDYVIKTLAWGATGVVLHCHFSNHCKRKRFPFLLRIGWVFYFSNSCYSLVVDIIFLKKYVPFPIQYLASGVFSVITGLFLCFVAFSSRREVEDALLEEPLWNGDSSVSNVSESSEKKGGDTITPYANAGIFGLLTFSWMAPLITVGNKKTLELEDVPQLDSSLSVIGAFPKFRNRLQAVDSEGTGVTTLKLVKALFLSAWKDILLTGLFTFMNSVALYVGPYLINTFVQYLNGQREFKNEGYHLVTAFFVAKLVECISLTWFIFKSQQVGLRWRAVLTAMIYNKGLTLSFQSKQSKTSGEIINIMSVDADRIGDFIWYMHLPWKIALQVALALLVLYKNLGAATFAAFVTTILVMLVNIPLGKVEENFQEKLMESKDKRMKATSEILRNMRILKLQGTKVSLDRIASLLRLDDLQPDVMEKLPIGSSDIAIEIIDGNFSWDLSSPTPTLKDLNLKVFHGMRVAVCGTVGSGKSSLLSCILGELPKISGTLKLCGTKAYVPQSPWIQSGKIEENILFGKEMERGMYERVLEACSLNKDLEILSYGDQTVIGERGINLSGGQKQRIQIARALYQDADVYLFDDPFSAVDAHTGSHLFKEVLLGLLTSKTVIYVTHQLEFLTAADLILVMKNGRITQAGKYNDILDSGSDFMELVGAHEKALSALDTVEAGSVSEKCVSEADGAGGSVIREMLKDGNESNKSGKVDDVGPKRQLVEEEEREKGNVRFSVYWKYITTAYGGALVPFILLAQILFQVFQIGSDYWMALASPVSAGAEHPTGNLTLILVYLALAIASAFTVFAISILVRIAGYKTATLLFEKMHLCIFRAPMSFFDSTPSGRILSRASTDQSAVDLNIPDQVADVAFSIMQLLGIIAVMSQAAWPIFIIFIPVVATCIWYQQYYISAARELQRLIGVRKAPIIQNFSETISGATTIRGFDQESSFQQKNMILMDAYSRSRFHSSSAKLWLCFRLDMLACLTFAFSLFFLISIPVGVIDPGIAGLAVTYGLSLNSLQPVLIWQICGMADKIISVERILQYSSIPSEPALVVETNCPDRSWPFRGEVHIHDLQVRYAPHMPLVLRGLTCTFSGGLKTGIVGRTGSGKTTLIQTLFRIVEPAAGRIIIDGVNISSIGLHDLRLRLSIIPQDPTMFEGTVRSNLDPLEEYLDEQIWEALDKCQLGDEVRKKEGKLDSPVGENGENWSMGQRQLVCLGRVLLKKSKILVLDEATASVDTVTDNLIQTTLKDHFSDCTVITIAHRITSVLDSDMVLLLSQGVIEEYDSPASLLENKFSSFAQLVAEYTARS